MDEGRRSGRGVGWLLLAVVACVAAFVFAGMTAQHSAGAGQRGFAFQRGAVLGVVVQVERLFDRGLVGRAIGRVVAEK